MFAIDIVIVNWLYRPFRWNKAVLLKLSYAVSLSWRTQSRLG